MEYSVHIDIFLNAQPKVEVWFICDTVAWFICDTVAYKFSMRLNFKTLIVHVVIEPAVHFVTSNFFL